MKNLRFIVSFLFVALGLFMTSAIITTLGVNPIVSIVASVGLALVMDVTKRYTSFGFSFTSICGEIATNMTIDCNSPLQSGTRERAWIMNFDDVANAVITYAADGYTIEDIVLPSGKSAYYIDGKNNSIRPNQAQVQQTYANMYDHSVAFLCFDISPAMKAELNAQKDGRFVVITENYYRGTAGNSAFEVYGLTSGLVRTALTRDPNSEENGGAYDFTLMTDKSKEPKLPNPLFVTSYAASKAVVEGLL